MSVTAAFRQTAIQSGFDSIKVGKIGMGLQIEFLRLEQFDQFLAELPETTEELSARIADSDLFQYGDEVGFFAGRDPIFLAIWSGAEFFPDDQNWQAFILRMHEIKLELFPDAAQEVYPEGYTRLSVLGLPEL